MKSKYQNLIKNSFWFMISSLGTSIISFLLTPIYTITLKPWEFGVIDLIDISSLLLFYVISLDFSDVVGRFSLDEKQDKPTILNIGIRFLIKSSLIVLLLVTMIGLMDSFHWEKHYYVYLFLQYFFFSTNIVLTQYIKGLDKVNIIALAGISSILVKLLAVLCFIFLLKMGIDGYYLASLLGLFFSTMLIIYHIPDKKRIINVKVEKKLEKEMIRYAFPMAINALGWWVAQGVDKYFVTYYYGYEENGIYSVSYKIPSIISILCTVFTQAFSISAVKELDGEHHGGFFKNTYHFFVCFVCLCCSFLIICNIYFTKILFANEYFRSWEFSSFLLMSALFSGLGSYMGGIIDALKKNSILAISTIVSAVINIVLNIYLIPRWGSIGAAVSTLISMFIIYLIRYIYVEKYVVIHKNIFLEYLLFSLLLVQVLLNQTSTHMYYIQFLIFLIIILLQMPVIKHLFDLRLQKKGKR